MESLVETQTGYTPSIAIEPLRALTIVWLARRHLPPQKVQAVCKPCAKMLQKSARAIRACAGKMGMRAPFRSQRARRLAFHRDHRKPHHTAQRRSAPMKGSHGGKRVPGEGKKLGSTSAERLAKNGAHASGPRAKEVLERKAHWQEHKVSFLH